MMKDMCKNAKYANPHFPDGGQLVEQPLLPIMQSKLSTGANH